VPTYTYPIEYWHYSGLDAFTRKPIKVEISLDLNTPNPTYALRNPPEKSIFPSLFNSRWYLFTVFGQGHKAQLRQKAEAAQWHFIDRFFGEGIKLHYLDAEYFSRQPVEVIRVEDWRYGRYYEAFFDRNSALLLAVRESFTPTEQEWYRKARRRGYPSKPPVWTTVFHRYQPINNVLPPPRTRTLERRQQSPNRPSQHRLQRRSPRRVRTNYLGRRKNSTSLTN
jgi:hypothetical protein